MADAVTVVEWGRGIAEGLAEDRLEIDIWRSPISNGGEASPTASGSSPSGRWVPLVATSTWLAALTPSGR